MSKTSSVSEKNSPKCDHSHAPNINSAFRVGISLNLIFVIVEIYYGVVKDSLALVSDALHNFSDVLGLLLAWLGVWLATQKNRKKFSIYAAVINSFLLLVSCLWVIYEAYERIMSGENPNALTMIWVALLGCFINFFTAKQFHADHHHDLNMKSAYLHLMADAAISLGVVLAGVAIYFTAYSWLDPVLSALISLIIIFSMWKLFYESLRLLSGKTPAAIDLEKLIHMLKTKTDGAQVAELKVWAISTSENAIAVTLQRQAALSNSQKHEIEHELRDHFRITQIDMSFKTDSN